jgi:uncharacterized protein YifN (PemK superfamily)
MNQSRQFKLIINGGDVLFCDFGPDPREPGVYPLMSGPISVPPEMIKRRQVVVISTPSAGLAVIVPFSTNQPTPLKAYHHFIPSGRYPFFSKDSWLKGDMIQSVSRARLDRLFFDGLHQRAALSKEDYRAVKASVLAGLGLSTLVGSL